MKTTMKLFAALTIMLGFTVTSFGQIVNNIAATANVLGALSVNKVTDLAFGNVALAGSKSVSIEGLASGPGSAGGTVTAGCFRVDKTTGTHVDVTFTTLPTPLIGSVTGSTLPITYDAATWNTSVSVGAGTEVSLVPNTPTQIDDSSPSVWVHLAGTVNPKTTGTGQTVVGTYTANVYLSAVYN
ncbi:MAG: hypothetical protein WCK09_19205 [Bacteroidota bacterium]